MRKTTKEQSITLSPAFIRALKKAAKEEGWDDHIEMVKDILITALDIHNDEALGQAS